MSPSSQILGGRYLGACHAATTPTYSELHGCSYPHHYPQPRRPRLTVQGRITHRSADVIHRSRVSRARRAPMRPREGGPECTVRTAATPTPGSSTRGSPRTAPSIRRRRSCSACNEAVHHRRADAADRAQALRRDRAVRPREGHRRRPQGLQGPSGHRGRPGLPGPAVEDALRRTVPPRCRPTRSGLAILGPLREPRRGRLPAVRLGLQAFESADDFEDEIACCVPSGADRAQLENAQPQPPTG